MQQLSQKRIINDLNKILPILNNVQNAIYLQLDVFSELFLQKHLQSGEKALPLHSQNIAEWSSGSSLGSYPPRRTFRSNCSFNFDTDSNNISRSGAVVARWAHNPKVVRSSRASATLEKGL